MENTVKLLKSQSDDSLHKKQRKLRFQDRLSIKHQMKNKSEIVLFLVKKPEQESCTKCIYEIFQILKDYQEVQFQMEEPGLNDLINWAKKQNFTLNRQKFTIFDETNIKACQNIDLILTVGGDGTILWAVSKFQNQEIPPILGISKGTLGFMCNYDIHEVEEIVKSSIDNIRSKQALSVEIKLILKATLVKKNGDKKTLIGMNEILIDRGINPTVVSLDIFLEDSFLTSTSGDGLILATPNGSTAYALSAGGPIVHNAVKSISLVPICPHSLSFRPMLLPSDVEIKIQLSQNCRTPCAYVTSDGKNQCKLEKGDVLLVTQDDQKAKILYEKQNFSLWVNKLKRFLNWNVNFIDQNPNEQEEK